MWSRQLSFPPDSMMRGFKNMSHTISETRWEYSAILLAIQNYSNELQREITAKRRPGNDPKVSLKKGLDGDGGC